MRGGMEAVYDDVRGRLGFGQFAPLQPARGPMFSARNRAKLAGQPPAPIVQEAEFYGDGCLPISRHATSLRHCAGAPTCQNWWVLHWLVYQQGGLRTVVIVEASHLLEARLRADLETPGLDVHFVEVHELDGKLAPLIPEEAIGRMMIAADAVKLIEALAETGRLDATPRMHPVCNPSG